MGLYVMKVERIKFKYILTGDNCLPQHENVEQGISLLNFTLVTHLLTSKCAPVSCLQLFCICLVMIHTDMVPKEKHYIMGTTFIPIKRSQILERKIFPLYQFHHLLINEFISFHNNSFHLLCIYLGSLPRGAQKLRTTSYNSWPNCSMEDMRVQCH